MRCSSNHYSLSSVDVDPVEPITTVIIPVRRQPLIVEICRKSPRVSDDPSLSLDPSLDVPSVEPPPLLRTKGFARESLVRHPRGSAHSRGSPCKAPNRTPRNCATACVPGIRGTLKIPHPEPKYVDESKQDDQQDPRHGENPASLLHRSRLRLRSLRSLRLRRPATSLGHTHMSRPRRKVYRTGSKIRRHRCSPYDYSRPCARP